ncbi:MAG: hypothetical protein HYX54_06190 [Chloroflexi bacterium]|nr:hypothetical protein [Chloroflexota bacterium]
MTQLTRAEAPGSAPNRNAQPLEDVRMQEVYGGARSSVNTILVVQADRPGRRTVILMRQAAGF